MARGDPGRDSQHREKEKQHHGKYRDKEIPENQAGDRKPFTADFDLTASGPYRRATSAVELLI